MRIWWRRIGVGSGLAIALLGLAGAAQAQRPVRVTLGFGHKRQTLTTFAGTRSDETEDLQHLHLGISYDVLRPRPALFGAVYYDYATNIQGGGGTSDYPYNTGAIGYAGLGFALRIHTHSVYAGAGLGAYHGGIGGKVFVGLQGRGDIFAETSITSAVHNLPAVTTSLGIRL